MKRKMFPSLAAVAFLAIAGSSADVEEAYLNKDLYTKVNMRYDAGRRRGSCIHYLTLTLLPAKSKVRLNSISSEGFEMTVPDGETIKVDYKKEWGGKTIEKILPDLFSASESDVSAGLEKLEVIDRWYNRCVRYIMY